MAVGDLLHAVARRRLEKPAVIFNNRTLTYRELDYASRALAHWFLDQGLAPGDRVAVHWGNSLECLELLLACLHAGLIAVPVNTRLKAPEVAYISGHAQPAMWFSQPELAPVAEAAGVKVRTQLPEVADDDERRLPHVADDQPCVLMYTSGATVRPKGVIHTQASVAASIAGLVSTAMSDSDCVVNMMSLMHVSGFCMAFSALVVGATTVLMAGFDPAAVLDAVERHRCTVGLGLPAMMQSLCAGQERSPRNVPALRWWGAAGDTVPVALQDRFARLFGIPLMEGYAMTECVPIAFNRPEAMRPGAMGLVIDGVEARVLDFTGKPVPDGEVGELAVKSAANFAGYWNDAAATANTLVDGWLLTGDLVRRDADGFLWFAGRRKA